MIEIEITIKKDGEVIGTRTALDWESAEENLGKLQRAEEKGQI